MVRMMVFPVSLEPYIISQCVFGLRIKGHHRIHGDLENFKLEEYGRNWLQITVPLQTISVAFD